MKPVVILIFAHKPQLEWFEEIALRQCFRILGKHPIRLVCPAEMEVSAYRTIAPELVVDFIPRRWLATLRAYNRLKILPFLYRRYAEYEFLLTYELDAFVFRDELLEWCAQGWDYIGAPWFEGYGLATGDAPLRGVGNSGFSLRRTQTMLRVLRTWRYQRPAGEVLATWRRGECSLAWAVAALTFRNNFFAPLNDSTANEDGFWAETAARRFPDFRLATLEAAQRFAFEANPERLYRENGGQLPFGCHKWMVYEPEFWRAHIEPFGHVMPRGAAVTEQRTHSIPKHE